MAAFTIELPKITSPQYIAFLDKFNEGGFPGQRLGGAFFVHFPKIEEKCDDDTMLLIFNETNCTNAKRMIESKFVE